MQGFGPKTIEKLVDALQFDVEAVLDSSNAVVRVLDWCSLGWWGGMAGLWCACGWWQRCAREQ